MMRWTKDIGWRTGVTLLAVAATLSLQRIPALPSHADMPRPDLFSVGVLGAGPWITAALVVEIGSLVRKRWRRLRTGGAAERDAQLRALGVIWLVVAGAQAFAMAVSLEAMRIGHEPLVQPGVEFRLRYTATLMAGSALIGLLARWTARAGLGGGFTVWILLSQLDVVIEGLAAEHWASQPPNLLHVIMAVLVPAGSTWWLLRDRPLPLPRSVAGIVPVNLALVAWNLRWLTVPWVAIGASALGTVLVGRALHDVDRINSELGAHPGAVVRALRSATALNALYAAVLVACILEGPALTVPATVAAGAIAMLTALVLDLADELRARAELGELVAVWTVEAAWLVPGIAAPLADVGIPFATRGTRFRRLMFFLGPYIPVEILVPSAREAEAVALLRSVRPGVNAAAR